MAPARILVVDDEPTIREVLASYLRREGYEALTAADGPSAVAAHEREQPDLLVLDVLLPGYDGLQVMARVRHRRPVPIILLTARGEEADRIAGLRLGADDYVVKPFSPSEVVARVGAVLRRAEPSGPRGPLRFGAVALDGTARTVEVDGRPVELTTREFDLLHHLARHPGRAFSRDELMQAVWRVPFYADTSTLTVHVRRVRQKIEPDPLRPRHLVTVWGVGYRLDP
jgi:DNA-binding response OmpR family regulator